MEQLGDNFDVIVIGAGVMGSSTAYHLAKRGHQTLLLEQFDFLHHRGSSHGESRTIRATYPDDYYAGMVAESAVLWEAAQSEAGYKVFFPTPHLDVGPRDDLALKSVIATCRKLGISHRVLDHAQMTEEFADGIRIPEDWVGVVTELGGVIKPSKAVSMFQTLASKHGATLKDNTKVETVIKDEGNGGIVVVTATGERFRGKKGVITAGAWVKKLVKIVSGIELPIQAVETTVCYWRVREGYESAYTIGGKLPTFAGYGDPFIYGTPSLEYPGLVKAALHGGNPCDPDKRPWGPGIRLAELKEWVRGRFGGNIESEEPVVTQLCMYSVTPDEDYVIDFLGGRFGKEVVVAGGFSGHGFKMGPAMGRILADLAVHGEAEGIEMKHFKIGRFENNPKGNVKNFHEEAVLGDAS